MITQPPDILVVSLAQARTTEEGEGGTALSIIGPVIDKAIEVAHDDGYISVGVGVDIHGGYNVVNARLAVHNILVQLD